MSAEAIIQKQLSSDKQVLAGLAYLNLGSEYKFKGALAKKAKILALGSSRVMEFRSEFFTNSFYNAGRGSGKISYVCEFISMIPKDASPEILLVALDHSGFIHEKEPDVEPMFADDNPVTRPIRLVAGQCVQVYRDFFSRKFHRTDLFHKQGPVIKIGMTAKAKNSGYRKDGSYLYPLSETELAGSAHDKYADSLKNILRGGKGYFQPSKELDPDRVIELAELIRECRKRGIHLIAFLPPFADSIYEAMLSRRYDYEYLEILPLVLRDMARKDGFSFFDFSRASEWGIGDNEMIDAFHASEKANLRLLLYMCSQDPVLAAVIDLPAQTHALQSTKKKCSVYDN